MFDPAHNSGAGAPNPAPVGYRIWQVAFVSRTQDTAYNGVLTLRDCHAHFPLTETAWARLSDAARDKAEASFGTYLLSFNVCAITPIADAF